MTEESPSKIKKEKVLKIVDKVSRIFLVILFAFGLYLVTAFAGACIESHPEQVGLIVAIVVNALISLAIYCRMD